MRGAQEKKIELPKRPEEFLEDEMISTKAIRAYDPVPPRWITFCRSLCPKHFDPSTTLACLGLCLVVLVDLLPLLFDGFGRTIERGLWAFALDVCQADEAKAGVGAVGQCVPHFTILMMLSIILLLIAYSVFFKPPLTERTDDLELFNM